MVTWTNISQIGARWTCKSGHDRSSSETCWENTLHSNKAPGRSVDPSKGVATMETDKWVDSLESPISGTIEETNRRLRRRPQVLNDDPYGVGWIALLKPSNPEETGNLIRGEGLIDWYKKEIEIRVKKK